MKKYHQISDLHFGGDFMILKAEGRKERFKVRDISAIWYRANEKEQKTFEISPSGYGIHWPLLDEDLAIDGLLGIVHAHRKDIMSA